MKEKLKQLGKNIFSMLGRLLILTIVLYILFNLGRSIWRNWQTNQGIKELENQLAQLQKQNEELKNQNLFYQSDTYKEIESRQKLGMKKADEKVVIIPENSEEKSSALKKKESSTPVQEIDDSPNPVKWYRFVIGNQ